MGIKIVDLVVLGGGPRASDLVHEVAVAMKGERYWPMILLQLFILTPHFRKRLWKLQKIVLELQLISRLLEMMKLIVTDVDGTLLDNNSILTGLNKKAILECRK